MAEEDTVAVIDVGKTHVKVLGVTATGRVADQQTTANLVRPGPPWPHHDLAALSDWIFAALAALHRRMPYSRIVASGHGSGGVLTAADPDANGDGAALPMIDYEAPMPEAIDREWAALSGGFFERGGTTLMASSHQGRQLFRMQAEAPGAVEGASHALAVAPYWAWRLSGTAVSEYTTLGAQSHLWNVPERRFAQVVDRMGWRRLLPDPVEGSADLGPVRPALARRVGLPEGIRVHAGGHDSSLNFHRYRAAGLSAFTVVSTGTWIVALSDATPLGRLDEARGMTCNAGVSGDPVAGALTMGGRAFAAIAGPEGMAAKTDPAAVARIVARGTMALPGFSADNGQFPGSGGRGRLLGPPPDGPAGARALGLLHAALLTAECLDALGSRGTVVIDGAFLADPAYAGLLAALRPDLDLRASREPHGVAAGAAFLATQAGRSGPAPVALHRAVPIAVPGLLAYAEDWTARARAGWFSEDGDDG
jgi:sugar (pentulose or hexulose) kinase